MVAGVDMAHRQADRAAAASAVEPVTRLQQSQHPLRVIDMFAGIGGFSLGLHRTGGFETVAVVELDPYASKVLNLRFPAAPNVGDVTTAEYPDADFICAGFPCQDISFAGAGAGLAGKRSGLWREVVRAIRVVRPRYALLENVAALLSRGLDTVLGDLAEIGHDAEWHCIPAAAVGAPHRRDRIWIITNPGSEQYEGSRAPLSGEIAAQLSCVNPNTASAGRPTGGLRGRTETSRDVFDNEPADLCQALADTSCELRNGGRERAEQSRWAKSANCGSSLADASCINAQGFESGIADSEKRAGQVERSLGSRDAGIRGFWAVEPNVGRVAHGIPKRVDRLRCLGNAVVPQIPELIGRAILASLDEQQVAA